MEPKRGLWATYDATSELELAVEAVASYRSCSALSSTRKTITPLSLAGSERAQNFDRNCPMRRNDVFDESHALVAVASNDFHSRGVSIGKKTQGQVRPQGAGIVSGSESGRHIPACVVTDLNSYDATPLFF